MEEYEQIDRLLFSAIVLDPLDLGETNVEHLGIEPLSFLRVKPREGFTTLSIAFSVPPGGSNRLWGVPESVQVSQNAHFGFIQFFDWDVYGFAAYPYFRVRVDRHSELPARSGQDGLIETLAAAVVLVERESD